MNLIIDIGNTQIKLAVFDGKALKHVEIIAHDRLKKSAYNLIRKYDCSAGIISNVGPVSLAIVKGLKKKISLIELSSETAVPFRNDYETPLTLGVDRIALAAAAVSNFDHDNVLIIDAGTCITYDFVNGDGHYLGGAISPGIQMRYNALHHYTDRLPLLKPEFQKMNIGKTTSSSMHIGVIRGVISEIDSSIKKYRKKNKNLTVVLTGGDVKFLANRLKNGIFANPNFLLEGLNAILTYNLE